MNEDKIEQVRVDFHLHVHVDDPILRFFANTRAFQQEIKQMITDVQTAVDQLGTDVGAEKTVVDSAIVLLNGIQAQIAAAVAAAQAAGATPAQLQSFNDLSAAVESNTKALADAVTANTPVAPPAP